MTTGRINQITILEKVLSREVLVFESKQVQSEIQRYLERSLRLSLATNSSRSTQSLSENIERNFGRQECWSRLKETRHEASPQQYLRISD